MFDQIKNMIQKMIFHLMDEQKNEDEHKHWCNKANDFCDKLRNLASYFYFLGNVSLIASQHTMA